MPSLTLTFTPPVAARIKKALREHLGRGEITQEDIKEYIKRDLQHLVRQSDRREAGRNIPDMPEIT